ncbi:hypothetical protein TNCV_4887801 [Trichonephila clavipes]|nr:hypothetical protein TNCV_4887801 [Trichonephila clavipes]
MNRKLIHANSTETLAANQTDPAAQRIFRIIGTRTYNSTEIKLYTILRQIPLKNHSHRSPEILKCRSENSDVQTCVPFSFETYLK